MYQRPKCCGPVCTRTHFHLNIFDPDLRKQCGQAHFPFLHLSLKIHLHVMAKWFGVLQFCSSQIFWSYFLLHMCSLIDVGAKVPFAKTFQKVINTGNWPHYISYYLVKRHDASWVLDRIVVLTPKCALATKHLILQKQCAPSVLCSIKIVRDISTEGTVYL